MDELKSLGLRVDGNENLRLLSDEADKTSREISAKSELLLTSK